MIILRSNSSKGYIRFRHKNIKIFKFQIPAILFNILISIIFGIIGSFCFLNIYFNSNLYLNNISNESMSYDNSIVNVVNKLNQSIVGVSAYIKNGNQDLIQNNMTGILYSEDGYIVTNFFGLNNAEKIYIKIPTTLSVIREAKVIGYNENYDICLLKIDGDGYVKGRFKENISGVVHGLKVISMSNITGNLNSYSIYPGVVSGFGIIDNGVRVIKSNININASNTGGAISDINGEIVGISSVNINNRFNSYGEGLSILISSQDIINMVDEIIMSAT